MTDRDRGNPEVLNVCDFGARRPAQPTILEVPGFINVVNSSDRLEHMIRFMVNQYGMSAAAVEASANQLEFVDWQMESGSRPPIATWYQRDPEQADMTRVFVSNKFPTILHAAGKSFIKGLAVDVAADATVAHGILVAQPVARPKIGKLSMPADVVDRTFKRTLWMREYVSDDGTRALAYRFAANMAIGVRGLRYDSFVTELDHDRPLSADVAGFANPADPMLTRAMAAKFLR